MFYLLIIFIPKNINENHMEELNYTMNYYEHFIK